jgi:GPI inositol-deacylase-like protein
MINHLRNIGKLSQFFFFRFGDESKRTFSACLKNIALQLTTVIPEFKKTLQGLPSGYLRLDEGDPTLIWQSIFESILFRLKLVQPIYWVIDALDEAEPCKDFLKLLKTLPRSDCSIRVLLISRHSGDISLALRRLSTSISVYFMENLGRQPNNRDVNLLVSQEIGHMSGNENFKSEVEQTIINRAQGNFLWVRLVLEKILNCDTEIEVQEYLSEVPDDMTLLYGRMEASLVNSLKGRGKGKIELAKSLLQWAICSRRSLTLEELSGALPQVLDLEKAIYDLCGQFIVVDQSGYIGMVHQTARDYLIKHSESKIAVKAEEGHEHLCLTTLSAISGTKLKLKLLKNQQPVCPVDPFVVYSSTSWSYHLRHSGFSDNILSKTVGFLQSSAVLTWIHHLAFIRRLDIVIKTAKALTHTINGRRVQNQTTNPMLHRLKDLDILEQWSIDLSKVVAKFGRHLIKEPEAIYQVIPPICPTKSTIYQQFHQVKFSKITTSGIDSSSWNDNLARIVLPNEDQTEKVTAAGPYLAVLGASGATYVWNSYSFTDVCTLKHLEPVTAFSLNKTVDQLATYGLKTTKLWHLPSGCLLHTISNTQDLKAMNIQFSDNDKKLVGAMDDSTVRYLDVHDRGMQWQILCDAPSRDLSMAENYFKNSPVFMDFNADHTKLGIAYRGFPLAIWSLTEHRCIAVNQRQQAMRSSNVPQSQSWFTDRFTFNPATDHVIGIYKGGYIFKWHPDTEETHQVPASADEIAASKDGKLFITSDSNGNISVWSFTYMSVIYRLLSTDLLHGLTFGPDTQVSSIL